MRIVAVDRDGGRHHLLVHRDGREARLRKLLDDGWAIEEVSSR